MIAALGLLATMSASILAHPAKGQLLQSEGDIQGFICKPGGGNTGGEVNFTQDPTLGGNGLGGTNQVAVLKSIDGRAGLFVRFPGNGIPLSASSIFVTFKAASQKSAVQTWLTVCSHDRFNRPSATTLSLGTRSGTVTNGYKTVEVGTNGIVPGGNELDALEIVLNPLNPVSNDNVCTIGKIELFASQHLVPNIINNANFGCHDLCIKRIEQKFSTLRAKLALRRTNDD